MKTKAIYSGILSIILFMSFFSDARGRRIINESQYRDAINRAKTEPKDSLQYKQLIADIRQYEADNPGLSKSRIPSENTTLNDVLNYQGDGPFSLRNNRSQENNHKGFSIHVNRITGISAKEKAETIEILAEFTSLSRKQISKILDSKNEEAVDQVRQLAIHVKSSRESVDPQTINTLVELAYNMKNREREAVQKQNYAPAVNVMLSLVRNISSMASSWAATPRNNALKLITAFNVKYKEFKAMSSNAGKSVVASALNAALTAAEGIKSLQERNARKREIDVLCRK